MATAMEVTAIAALFPILVTSKEATVEANVPVTPQETLLVLVTEQESDMALVPDMPKVSLASPANKDLVSPTTAQDTAVMAIAPPEYTVDMVDTVDLVDMVAPEAMAAMEAAASVI